MRAVILAAGYGGRLGHATIETPKPLVKVSGRPLVGYTLEALAEASVSEAVFITGYRASQLREGVERWSRPNPKVFFVHNPRFEGGASLSLRAAREACGDEPFLLLMADHMLSTSILKALIGAYRPGGPSLIATDASPWPPEYIEEATRVQLAPGTQAVANIGKRLAPWDALDTGAFLLSPECWPVIDSAPEDCELSVIFGDLARRQELHAVDVSGSSWYDVDTAADLEAATRLVAAGGGR